MIVVPKVKLRILHFIFDLVILGKSPNFSVKKNALTK